MFNVTTKYDKIYDEELGKEVRKKVFMIRGNEAYAKSTDIVLTNSTPTSGDIKGFLTTLTATVHRNIGSSKVVFYDGEEILGMVNLANNSHTATLSNIYLSYVNEHQLYAQFVGNSQCLGSKSKKVKVSVAIPSSLTTTITFNTPTTQINNGSSTTISATAKINNVLVDDGTEIIFYDDNTPIATCETTDGVASTTYTPTTQGRHTIKAVIESSSTLNSATSSYTLDVGYDLSFNTYPSTFINGVTNTVKVLVKTWGGTKVSSASVSLTDSSNKTTDANGLATFTFMNATTKDYTASYGGSSVTQKIYAYTPSAITITPSATIVGAGEKIDVNVNIEGVGDINNISVPITGVTASPQSIIYSANGITTGTTTYTGVGLGDVTMTATLGTVSKSYTFKDYLMYWTLTLKKNMQNKVQHTGAFGETTTGLRIGGAKNDCTDFIVQTANCEMEFDVVSISSPVFSVGTTHHTYLRSNLKAKDKVKVSLLDGVQKTYINGTLVDTYSNSNTNGDWRIKVNSTSGPTLPMMVINNLKIKRLR